jgi:phage terminase large subunit-like protein
MTASYALSHWRSNPIEFIETCLHDPETGRPFVLLAAERDFLGHAFTRDADGRLLYPEMVYSAPKKSGKTTLQAIFIITVVLLYGGRFGEGLCCANDLEQSLGRVFLMITRIIRASPMLAPDAKIIADRVSIGDATIRAITSDYASAAGANQNVAGFDELWAYASERAHRLFDELVPPPTRQTACRLTVTYAGFAGESTLLESLYERGMAQPEIAPNLHAGDGILMAWHHEPVAPWQDARWLADMRRSLRPNQYRRMIENYPVSADATFIDLDMWDAIVDPRLGHMVSDHSLACYAGVDASVKHDSTALALVTFDHTNQRVRLCDHCIFMPTPAHPIDFVKSVEATLIDWHARFNLRAVYYDPFQMASTAQRLSQAYLKMCEFPQSIPNLTAMAENLYELVKGRSFSTYPDADIRTAIARSVAVEGSRGWKISKEKQSHKIDIVVALGMAALAAVRDQTGQQIYDDMAKWVGQPDVDANAEWQRLRNYWYLTTGGIVRL